MVSTNKMYTYMKKLFLSVFAAVLSLTLFAQNESADNIIGTYSCGIGETAVWVRE